ncbi:hypothetical protein BH11CYA1_BH11CYA1_01910 [soil metagenome]
MTRRTAHRSLTASVLILFSTILALESSYLLALIIFLDTGQKELTQAEKLCQEVSAIASFSADLQFGSNVIADRLHFRALLLNFQRIFQRVPQGLKSIKLAFKDRPEERDDLQRLELSVNRALALINKVFEVADVDKSLMGYVAQRNYGIDLYAVSNDINNQIENLNQKYQNLERSTFSTLVSQSEQLLYLVLIVGFATNAVVAISIYWFFFRGFAYRLSVIATSMRNFGSGMPLPAPIEGNDEIAHLDQAFRSFVLKLAQRKSRESLILENSASFICSLNRNGIVLSAPAKDSSNWGYAADELVGKRFVSVVVDGAELSYAALQDAFEKPTYFENQLMGKDGTIFDLSWSAMKGADDTVVCVAQDLSERKRIQAMERANEERFRQIINSLPLAVLSCDGLGKIELANNAVAKISGFGSTALYGRNILPLFSDVSTVEALLNQETNQKSNRVSNHTLLCKDGTTAAVELNVVKYFDDTAEKFIVCFSDISTTIEIERAKRDFVSMIAHDLRSPLFALHGTLTMLSTDEAEHNGAIFVESERTVSGLIALINDFLALGKLEAGQEALDIEVVDVAHFWSSLEDYLDDTVGGLTIKFEPIADSLPALKIDRPHVFSAVAYLITLIDYLNLKKGTVHLSCKVENKHLLLAIYAVSCRLPAVIKANCTEGYSMISLDAQSDYSALRLALCRAAFAQLGGSLSVQAHGDSDAIVVAIPLSS